MKSIELLHPDLPDLLDELLRHQGWSWESVEAGNAKLAGRPVSVDDLSWWLMCEDPVVWAECNLVNRPEDGGGLWRFFEYQKSSMRLRGNVVHQDGAEVGKTREIVALICWGCAAAARGSVLVGSALDGDLDEIWEELQFQIDQNRWLHAQAAKPTTKPYRRQAWANGLKTLFRPAGHDGSAYRGVHVRGMLLHDEAAKVVNPRAWSEFWRAGKPGCEVRIYSVPTGDRLCTFQRIADSATPAERVVPALWDARTIVRHLLRGIALPKEVKTLSRELGGRTWVRFHWPKTIMPAPFWSDDRRQQFVEMYGSPDDPGYVHNVLGLPGDPEFSVFPERLLSPAVRYIAEYRTISCRWDSRAQRVDILSRRLNPQYTSPTSEPGLEADLEEEEGIPEPPFIEDHRDSVDMSDFHALAPEERGARIRDLARALVGRPAGFLTCGVDVASSTITEICVEASSPGGLETWVLRIHLSGWDWYSQAALILALEEQLQPEGGWGLDATGAGKALLDVLQGVSYAMRERLSGFVFNVVVPALNSENGEPQTDPQTGRILNIAYKELATQLLERTLARRAKVLPADPELLHLLQNHTCTDRGGARTYSKHNDHVVDAWRTAALRRYTCAFGAATTPPPVVVLSNGKKFDASGLSGF